MQFTTLPSMGIQARFVPALALASFLAVACGESGEEASVPTRPRQKPRVEIETEAPGPEPTTDVPLGPGFAILDSDGPGSNLETGPELPPDFDLHALLRAAEREITGPEQPALPPDPPAFLIGVIRMRGQTVFVKLAGSVSQLSLSTLTMRQVCQSFELVEAQLQWTAPETVNAEFGLEGSMVPARLTLVSDPTVTGSVTLLGGDGGGLDANVLRWLRQLRRPTPTEDALKAFLGRQERFLSKGGLDVVIVDLSQEVD